VHFLHAEAAADAVTDLALVMRHVSFLPWRHVSFLPWRKADGRLLPRMSAIDGESHQERNQARLYFEQVDGAVT
jgi:hypothetical protein